MEPSSSDTPSPRTSWQRLAVWLLLIAVLAGASVWFWSYATQKDADAPAPGAALLLP